MKRSATAAHYSPDSFSLNAIKSSSMATRGVDAIAESRLDNPVYVDGKDEDAPVRRNENGCRDEIFECASVPCKLQEVFSKDSARYSREHKAPNDALADGFNRIDI